MRLSDIMSQLGLAAFPIIGMLLFLSVFVGVLFRVTRRHRKAELDYTVLLPLADEVLPLENR
ncbi:MAG: hypothetical protein IT435_19270 [Phycisphaerales bacterium]|nr:hypothetical protein [Phycisphaerales bacterium]